MNENISALLSKVDAQYKNDYCIVCLDRRNLSDAERRIIEDGTNLDKSNTFMEVITDDLSDKGFTDSEIEQIATNQLDKETALKYIAYVVSLLNDYNSYEEFLTLINEEYSEYVTQDTYTKIKRLYDSLN